MADLDGNTVGRHRAFGRPDTSYASSVTGRGADGPAISSPRTRGSAGPWDGAGTMYVTIPAGGFGETSAAMRCH
ncbi:hypothetical protein [Actinoallomurus iriomotensis]|nr:hypothetical protein [Actinoallomurus iriomotensis]